MTQFISFGITWTLINTILGQRVLEAHVDGVKVVILESTPHSPKANVTWSYIWNPKVYTDAEGTDYAADFNSRSGHHYKTAKQAAGSVADTVEFLRRKAAFDAQYAAA